MRYFAFYNGERPHQGLNYQTPDVVYQSGEGGGAMIVDKYGSAPKLTTRGPAPTRCVEVQDTSLNSGKNCLEGWVHFSPVIDDTSQIEEIIREIATKHGIPSLATIPF